jgi:hypothetical protein
MTRRAATADKTTGKITIRVTRHMIDGDKPGEPLGPFDSHDDAVNAIQDLLSQTYIQGEGELTRPDYTIDK